MTDAACVTRTGKIAKTETRWRPPLRAAQPYVTGKHTQRARSFELTCKMPGKMPGKLPGKLPVKMAGSMFACVGGKEPLLASHARWDTGTGWPSCAKRASAQFAINAATKAASKHADRGGLARRIEISVRSNAHLTHVCPVGLSKATGLRGSINGPALEFKPGGT